MFFVEHTQYLRRETFDIPVECVGEKERLRVLFLLPPVDSGCPLQFSMQVLETLVRTCHDFVSFPAPACLLPASRVADIVAWACRKTRTATSSFLARS